MQIFQKTKGFCNKLGLFRKKLNLFNKNYICIPRKKSNPGHWVLEKTIFEEKNRDPCIYIRFNCKRKKWDKKWMVIKAIQGGWGVVRRLMANAIKSSSMSQGTITKDQ